jgi:hypothetical protein
MTTQQLYRRDLKPGDTYGASLNDATPTFRVDEDGDTIDLRNGAVRHHGLASMVHHVVRASAPPAPVRKGRVGMRLNGNETGRIVTLTYDRDNGYWDAVWADGKRDVVRDDYIGNHWLVLPDAPADTRAESVQRRDDLRPGDRFRYVDGRESSAAPWVVLPCGGDGAAGGSGRSLGGASLVCNVIRAAAPVAPPEVVRDMERELAAYEAEQRRDSGHAAFSAAHDDGERTTVSLAWSAAVTLRLAARAEERRLREMQHCQPNWAGGDDVDA